MQKEALLRDHRDIGAVAGDGATALIAVNEARSDKPTAASNLNHDPRKAGYHASTHHIARESDREIENSDA